MTLITILWLAVLFAAVTHQVHRVSNEWLFDNYFRLFILLASIEFTLAVAIVAVGYQV